MAKSAKKAAFLKKVLSKVKPKGKVDEEGAAHEKTESAAEETKEGGPMAKKFGNLMKAVKK